MHSSSSPNVNSNVITSDTPYINANVSHPGATPFLTQVVDKKALEKTEMTSYNNHNVAQVKTALLTIIL